MVTDQWSFALLCERKCSNAKLLNRVGSFLTQRCVFWPQLVTLLTNLFKFLASWMFLGFTHFALWITKKSYQITEIWHFWDKTLGACLLVVSNRILMFFFDNYSTRIYLLGKLIWSKNTDHKIPKLSSEIAWLYNLLNTAINCHWIFNFLFNFDWTLALIDEI